MDYVGARGVGADGRADRRVGRMRVRMPTLMTIFAERGCRVFDAHLSEALATMAEDHREQVDPVRLASEL